MLAPVMVDLGPEVGPAAIEIVLDACNEVIQNGVCLPEGAAHAEAPRATAVARADDAALVVHIEVRLRLSEQTSWLMRELRFDAGDPTDERWRSVGLAIATLVGEGERQRTEQAEAAPEEPAPPEPTPPEAAPPEPPRDLAPSNEARSPAGASPARSGGFVGIGLLTGPAFEDDAWRLGGSVRGGYSFGSGIQLLSVVDYSRRVSGQSYSASWLSLQAGVGYRFSFSERVSAAVTLRAGAQQMRFEAPAGAGEVSRAIWNPLAALGVDALWLLTPGFGVWAAADAQSIGRETRLFVAPEQVDAVTSRAVDVSGVVGLGFWIP